MKLHIDSSSFGSITIGGGTYEYDVVIRPDGAVEKRKKNLSKEVYGTSHILSKDEAKHVRGKSAGLVIIGTGQDGVLDISPEAFDYFTRKGCRVEALKTPDAVRRWNETDEDAVGLFHVTC